MHGDYVLPEWLEAGIDPALRNSDEDSSASLPPPQSISSAVVPRPSGSAGITPVILTPVSSTPGQNTKEGWRDLDKFYASDSEQSEPPSGSEEEEEDYEDSGDGDGDGDDHESNDDNSDGQSREEIEKNSER